MPPPQETAIAQVVTAVVMLCWLVFTTVFLLRGRPPAQAETRRDPRSLLGIVLQGAGFAVGWSARRAASTPLVPMPLPAEAALGLLACACAAGSVFLVASAVRTLGKQWALPARLVEGHRLVTSGPYARVRHPIYAGMGGLLLSTMLAISRPAGIPAALGLFALGTWVRVRSEERLLREAFGPRFDDYARSVAALVPGIW